MRDKVIQGIEIFQEQRCDIVSALKLAGVNSPSVFYKMIHKDPEIRGLYQAAKRICADRDAHETVIIADTETNPARARNMIEARRWRAGVYDRDNFGDKIHVDQNVTVDIGSALAAAKSRSLPPPRHLAAIAMPQVIDIEPISAASETDKQSVEQPSEAASSADDDIFGD